MYGLGHIADIRQSGGGVSSQFETDFGVVELPPKLHAELERIDAHLKRQFKVLATQFANAEPLAMEDLVDAQSQAA